MPVATNAHQTAVATNAHTTTTGTGTDSGASSGTGAGAGPVPAGAGSSTSTSIERVQMREHPLDALICCPANRHRRRVDEHARLEACTSAQAARQRDMRPIILVVHNITPPDRQRARDVRATTRTCACEVTQEAHTPAHREGSNAAPRHATTYSPHVPCPGKRAESAGKAGLAPPHSWRYWARHLCRRGTDAVFATESSQPA